MSESSEVIRNGFNATVCASIVPLHVAMDSNTVVWCKIDSLTHKERESQRAGETFKRSVGTERHVYRCICCTALQLRYSSDGVTACARLQMCINIQQNKTTLSSTQREWVVVVVRVRFPPSPTVNEWMFISPVSFAKNRPQLTLPQLMIGLTEEALFRGPSSGRHDEMRRSQADPAVFSLPGIPASSIRLW